MRSLILALVVGAGYVLTLHPMHTWDGLMDALMFRTGEAMRWPWSAAHPLADLLQAQAVAGAADPLWAMAAFNAACCAAAVAVMDASLRATHGRPSVAPLLLAVSGAWWFYAGNAEAYGPGLLGASLALAAVARYTTSPGPSTAGLAGAATGLAALLHVANGAFAVAFLAAWWPSRRVRDLAAFAGAALALVLPALAAFLTALALPATPGGWAAWMRISLGTPRPDLWWPGPAEFARRAGLLLAGLQDASEEVLPVGHGLPVLGAAVTAGAVGLAGWLASRPGPAPALRWPLLASVAALACAFAGADPKNEYLVVLLVPFWWLVGVEAARSPASPRTLMAGAAVLAALNLAVMALPNRDPDANPFTARARQMLERLGPQDHLYVLHGSPGMAVRYEALGRTPVYVVSPRALPEELAAMHRHALALVESGEPVWMDRDLLERIGSDNPDAADLRAVFRGLRAVPGPDPLLYRLVPR